MAEPSLSTNITTASEKNVVFPVEGRTDGEGYLTKAGSGSKVGLVLIQEWWGLNKSITITAEKFAEQGFQVICPDIYRGKVAKNHEEAGHLLGGLDFVGAVQDIKGAVLHLKKAGCSKVGITGFCMGGALTIAAACSFTEVDAVVPFYGIPDTSKFLVSNIKCPVYLNFASNDDLKGFSDPESAKVLAQSMEKAGVKAELKVWEGAGHAFMNQDSPRYVPEVAKQALEETVNWFKKHLV